MKYSRWLKTENLIFIFVFTLVNAISAFAGPAFTTYQAKIIKPDGLPLISNNVNFKFTVLNPAGSCILYAETYSAVDMSSTGGLVSFSLGTGVKTYPVSATTFEQVFSNMTSNLSCQAGGVYTPSASGDTRKVVMQFHDGVGWQTLPAMSINAVPYSMFATDAEKLGGVSSSAYVKFSSLPSSCGASEAIHYNGSTFSCLAVGSGGGGSVTSGSVISALGYTPADGASITAISSSLTSTNSAVTAVSSSVSTVSSNLFTVSSTVSSLSASVTSLSSTVSGLSASMAAITSSQWTTSGTTINYLTGRVGIGTTTPATTFDVSGGLRIGVESATCAPALAGTLRYNASNVEYCNGTTWSPFGVAGAGITNVNGSVSATQSFVFGITGLAPAIATVNGVHSFNIPYAASAGVTAGLLSFNDYSTFNNKLNATSAAVITALGYTPADAVSVTALTAEISAVSATANTALTTANAVSSTVNGLASSLATTNSNLNTVSNTVAGLSASMTTVAGNIAAVSATANSALTTANAVSSSVNSLSNTVSGLSASMAAVTSSQWSTSGTTINYLAGNVGIGISTPVTKLDVSGGIRIGLEAATCDSTFAGTLRYNSGVVEYCNGTSWAAFGVSGAGILAINGLASGSQTFAFGSLGTTPNVSSVGSVHTFNFPFASVGTTIAGVISNADYLLFNNKITSSAASVAEVLGYTAANSATVSALSTTVSNKVTSSAASIAEVLGYTAANSATVSALSTTVSNKVTSSAASIAEVLGYVPASATAAGNYVVKTNNLSDLSSSASARTNLGLGSFATASSVDLGSASATGTLADARLPNQANVTSGTQYTKVTVDGKGRVISGAQIALSDVTTALGYTPASASASTQWNTSGTTINYTAGAVGVGTTAPSYKLDVSGTARVLGRTLIGSQAASGTFDFGGVLGANATYKSPLFIQETMTDMASEYSMGSGSSLKLNPVTGTNNAAFGNLSFVQTQASNPASYSLVYAYEGVAEHRGAGDITDLAGVGGLGLANTSGTVYNLRGIEGHAYVAAGSVTYSMAGEFTTLNLGTTPIVNAYGVRIETAGGPIYNNYGLYIHDQSTIGISSTYNIFSEGTTANNVFMGQVGIGVMSPAAKLQLAAGTTSIAPLKFTSGALLASPQSGSVEYDGFGLYLTDGAGIRRSLAMAAASGSIDNANIINSTGNINLVPVGSVVVSSTTASTNSQTGSLIVKGGMGIAGNINSSGTIITNKIGIGTSGASSPLSIVASGSTQPDYSQWINTSGIPLISAFSDSALSGSQDLLLAGATNTAGNRPVFMGRKSRGTLVSPTALVSGDTVASFLGSGYDGNAFANSGSVDFVTSGTVASGSLAMDISFKTGVSTRTERMRIDSVGNVGIGLVGAAATKFHVSGAGLFTGRVTASATTIASETLPVQGSYIGWNINNGGGKTNFMNHSGSGAGGFEWNLFNSSGVYQSTPMIINGSGNVGLGTSNPSGQLHIADATTPDIRLENTGATSSAMRLLSQNGLNYIQSGASFGAASAVDLRFTGMMGVSTVMALQVSTGNVAIGFNTPTAKLHVGSGTATYAPLKFVSGTLTTSAQSGSVEYDGFNLYFTDGTNSRRMIATASSSGTFDASNLNSTANITMTPSGSVVVSSTTASTNSQTGALIVNGGVGVAGNIYSSGTIITSNNIQAASITAIGDVYVGNRLGIGTSAPAELLHLYAAAGVSRSIVRTSWTDATAYGEWNAYEGSSYFGGMSVFGTSYSTVAYRSAFMMTAANNNLGSLIFRTRTGGAYQERMNISNNGNVGIGITTPSSLLHVSGGANVDPSLTYGSSATVIINGGLQDIAFGGAATSSPWSAWMQVRSSASTAGGLAINPLGGNVGIGVSAPTARLHIASGTSTIAAMRFVSGTLTTTPQSGTMEYDGAGFYLTDGGGVRRVIAAGSTSGTIDNASIINSSGNMNLVPTGSVVVSSTTTSTNSSTGALIVKGGLGVAGNIYSSGTIITTSNIQGASITATSGMIAPYIAGSIVSGGSITIDSSTHASKGNILLAPNGGGVGIGTTGTPESTLNVSGAIQVGMQSGLYSSLGINSLVFARSAASGTYSYIDQKGLGGALAFRTSQSSYADTQAMTIISTGKVGIGTSTPVGTLSVESATVPSMQMKKNGAAAIDTINFINDMDSTGDFWIAKGSNATSVTNGNQLMKITNEGNFEFYGQQVDSGNDKSGIISIITESSASGGNRKDGSLEFYTHNADLTDKTGYVGFETNNDHLSIMPTYGYTILGASSTEQARVTSSGLAVKSTTPLDYVALFVNGSAVLGTGNSTFGNSTGTHYIVGTSNSLSGGTGLMGVHLFGNSNSVYHATNNMSIDSTIIGRSNVASASSIFNIFGKSNTLTSGSDSYIAGAYNSASGFGTYTFGSFINNTIAGSLQIGVSNTAKITILGTGSTSGNVGINTTAPKARLSVTGGSQSASMPTKGQSTNTQFYITNSDTNYGLLMGVLTSGTSWIQSQNTNASSVAYPLYIQPNGGDVQIGSDNDGPLGALSTVSTYTMGTSNSLTYMDNSYITARVIGDYNAVGRVSAGSAAGYTNYYVFGASNTLSQSSAYTNKMALGFNNTVPDNGGSNIILGSGITTAATSSVAIGMGAATLNILSTGRVGVGTSAPAGVFHVDGGSTTNGSSITLKAGDAQNVGSWGGVVNITAGSASAGGASGGAIVITAGNGNGGGASGGSIILIPGSGTATNGKVGISTTLPAYPLDVSGAINIASGSALRFGGTIVCTSGGCTSSSDIRLKENVQPLEFSIEKLLALNAVQYDWKDKAKFGDKHQIGFIAQELEKAYPEVVYTDKDSGYKSVSYDKLVAPIIEALKVFNKRIAELFDRSVKQQRQISSVEQENAALKSRVEKTEKENAELKKRLDRIEKALSEKK
ncbi:hypothetical protein CIK05_11535 [Bdellovibrio sp. qaytius]|nr:hypothetical protein CIK05_11535 [Bdellovibrio sp. qaytius]